MGRSPIQHQINLKGSLAAAQEALVEAANEWGAEWQPDSAGGVLQISVSSGLRRGTVRGRVTVVPVSPDEMRCSFEAEKERLELNVPAIGFLLLGALGCGGVVLWPFFPKLLPLAPVGFLIAVATWLMVVARLRNSGIEEFLDLVTALCEE